MTLRRESFNVCFQQLDVRGFSAVLRRGFLHGFRGCAKFRGLLVRAADCFWDVSVRLPGPFRVGGLFFFSLCNFGACFRAEFREVLTRAGCFRRLALTIGSTFIFLAHASLSFSASSDVHFRVALIRSVRRAPVCLFNAVVQQTNSM